MDPMTSPRLVRIAAQPAEAAKKLLRRISCELDFARSFATLGGDAAWPALIEHATAVIDGCAGDVAAAVAEAEAILAPIGVAAKAYTIHCVGHGHIDMNWMWSWQETVATTHDTFQSVLQLMREYPALTYSQSQASVYALMEKYHPELFEEIKARIAEGRWEVTAVHWVEGDKNLASGESIARHLLYTRQYTKEKFGLDAAELPLDWEPDTFGHANTIPTILAQGGVKFYYACRLGGGFDHAVTGEFPRPKLFWWQGPDGSRVLVNKESTWYNSYVNIGDNIALPAVEFFKDTQLTDWLNVYGIGNHGGGPTRVEIEYLQETVTWPIYPSVTFGTAKGWYEKVAASDLSHLPVLDHELNYEFTGCYTTQTLITQANRFGENYCIEAETLAAITGRDSRALLREAWINILFNQFHDILPGSGVRQTREHAMALFQETGAMTGAIKREAGKALVSGLNTAALLPPAPSSQEPWEEGEPAGTESPSSQPSSQGWEEGWGGGKRGGHPFASGAGAGIGAMESGISKSAGGGSVRPYVVYNPCAWPRTEAVTVRLYDTSFEPGRIVARDEHGDNHPTFFLTRGDDWGHSYIDVLFFAQNVPALGYKTYALCEGRATVEVPQVKALPRDVFETPFGMLRFDRYKGGLVEVHHQESGITFLEGDFESLGEWELTKEQPRGMTAWVLGGALESQSVAVSGHHVHGVARNRGTSYPSGSSMAYVVHQSLKVPGTKSTIKVQYLVHGFAPRVDVTAEIDWREIGDSERGIPGLRVHFPFDGYEGLPIRFETPFGSVVREDSDGEEVPGLRYTHVPLDSGGFTLLNDSKYGFMVEGGNLAMRMIRSSFDPDHAPEVCKHTIRYAMVFHDTAVDASDLTRMGAAFNHPLIAFPAGVHEGNGPLSKSFASVETPNVLLTSLKKAEDGNGVIVRLVEYDGQDCEATVILAEGFGKTATVTDLMENPSVGAASFDGTTLRVKIRANSLVSVRLQ
jgi:alpha-mannosidase